MASNVFAAIGFDAETMNALEGYRAAILQRAPRTRITHPENWHVTLVFLGKTDRIEDAVETLDRLDHGSFPVLIGGFGTFGKRDRRVLWAGVDPSPGLMDCQRTLQKLYRTAGFQLQERAFKPHITFSYKWDPRNQVDMDELRGAVAPIFTKISSVRLLISEPEQGRTHYRELFRKELHD